MMRHRRHHLELRHVSGLADQQGLYSDGKGPIYRNTPARRLALRIWARETNTTYSYNYAGELWVVNYADATPDLTYTYDRRGRQTNIVASGGTALTRVYNDGGQVLSESYTGGPLNGISVTNGYDQFLRRTNLTALRTSTPTRLIRPPACKLSPPRTRPWEPWTPPTVTLPRRRWWNRLRCGKTAPCA